MFLPLLKLDSIPELSFLETNEKKSKTNGRAKAKSKKKMSPLLLRTSNGIFLSIPKRYDGWKLFLMP